MAGTRVQRSSGRNTAYCRPIKSVGREEESGKVGAHWRGDGELGKSTDEDDDCYEDEDEDDFGAEVHLGVRNPATRAP